MGGGNLLSMGDMAALTAAEEKRLGVNSPEFMERHNEIMKMADEIIVISNGKLVGKGTHKDLIENNDYYKVLQK